MIFNSDLFLLYGFEITNDYKELMVASFDGTYLLENLKINNNIFIKRNLKKLGMESAQMIIDLIDEKEVESIIISQL